jgi:hypothetical protein
MATSLKKRVIEAISARVESVDTFEYGESIEEAKKKATKGEKICVPVLAGSVEALQKSTGGTLKESYLPEGAIVHAACTVLHGYDPLRGRYFWGQYILINYKNIKKTYNLSEVVEKGIMMHEAAHILQEVSYPIKDKKEKEFNADLVCIALTGHTPSHALELTEEQKMRCVALADKMIREWDMKYAKHKEKMVRVPWALEIKVGDLILERRG